MYEDLKKEAKEAFEELVAQSHFREGSLIVIGGSSSEIRGGRIGKDSSYEVGQQWWKPFWKKRRNTTFAWPSSAASI
jgi:uncharacterized protein YwlG (UPF0340 family)